MKGNMDSDILNEYDRLKLQLEEVENNKATGARIRSKIDHLEQNKKGKNFFWTGKTNV